MDEQMIRLLAMGDTPEAQQHILSYFDELKKQDNGWQICCEVLTQNRVDDERVKFFCLQVLEAHIKTKYASSDQTQQNAFKLCLQQWYQHCCQSAQKTFIRNKSAQLFCLIFVQEYPQKWNSFFNEMLSLVGAGPLGIDAYLRVLVAIDEEVVARQINHTDIEFQRNTAIKDRMRDHCVTDLVESWFQILNLPDKDCESSIKCMCFQVIGAYISWIDINLIANDRFISKILEFLSHEEIRESACECLQEIVNKGMDSAGKTRLVESLSDVLVKIGVMDVSTEEMDVEFLIKLSTLLNRMGVQLILSFNKLTKEESATNLKMEILQAIDKKIGYMIRFLSDEDDDVSFGVFEFCHSYLGLLKQLNGCNPLQSQGEHIKKILHVILNKMKYDHEYNFDRKGKSEESEAEFLEFRKEMKVLFGNLAKLNGGIVIVTSRELITAALNNWRNMSIHDIELAIYVLYCLGEAFPGNILYNDPDRANLFSDMMNLLITSDVSQHGHWVVLHQYFETVTRYERFFATNAQHLPALLMSFLDERGLKNQKDSIRSRTSFLLMRFVKALKTQVQPFVNDILKQIEEVLNLQHQDNGCVKVTENDKYYLYEASAILITCSTSGAEKQQEKMGTLLSPVITLFQQICEQLQNGQLDEIGQLDGANRLQHLMAYASRASKAFSTVQSMKNSGCAQCFTEALSIFLHSLTIPVHRAIIHSGVRQYLHRMIICLGQDVLPYVPVAVTHLLKDCEMADIQDFIPLINQLITRFKSSISPFLTDIFMPLVSQVFAFLQAPTESNDQQALREKQLLQRSYYLFIATITNMSILEVISSQESNNVKEILLSIVHGAVEVDDPQAQKTCFIICNKLVDNWGGDESFKEFVYEHIVPACFMAPLKSTFNLEDAQTYLALQEIANVQKTILQKWNVEFLQYLIQTYLPQNNCPPDMTQEYAMALEKMDNKTFKNYLKAFYAKAKT
ncbi:exportin-T-like [Clytia hemisphaerica]|uniref:Exportin-T n=1 Tax=Clytia hemisphaerica TaxID=252671 RepID=A0A7M5WRB7_9CNID